MTHYKGVREAVVSAYGTGKIKHDECDLTTATERKKSITSHPMLYKITYTKILSMGEHGMSARYGENSRTVVRRAA